MKQILLVVLQLLVALGLVGGIVLLEGQSVSLQKLIGAILVVYLTGLLDYHVFFNRAVHIGNKARIAIGIFSGLMFVLVWVWLFLIVRAEQGI